MIGRIEDVTGYVQNGRPPRRSDNVAFRYCVLVCAIGALINVFLFMTLDRGYVWPYALVAGLTDFLILYIWYRRPR